MSIPPTFHPYRMTSSCPGGPVPPPPPPPSCNAPGCTQPHSAPRPKLTTFLDAAPTWTAVEDLLRAQLYSLHGQSEKLDHIIAQLALQQQQQQLASMSTVPSGLVEQVRQCLDDGIERVKVVVADLVQQNYSIPSYTQFQPNIPWTPVSNDTTNNAQNAVADQSSPTLAPALSLDDIIDMRPYENSLAGLDLPPDDGMDYDNMSLSSGIESLPSEYGSSRLPTPDDFLIAVETTPDISFLTKPPTAATASPVKRTLRERRPGQRPDYVNHPMDSDKRRKRRAASTRRIRVRSISPDSDDDGSSLSDIDEESVRGLSTARVVFLPASDGQTREGGKKWWSKGENTLRGRMREVSCEVVCSQLSDAEDRLEKLTSVCKGRAHWACSGLPEEFDLGKEAWACPDCLEWLGMPETRRPQEPEPVQQERCFRPDCIMRSSAPVIKRPGDEARHFVERIIGRRVLSRRTSGKRVYEYLIQWEGWPLSDCTWEPPNRVDGPIKTLEEDFVAACAKEGLNDRAKVVLLPEAEDFWDENGDLRREYLEDLGVPPAEWWPKPRGKYTLKVS